MLIFGTSGQTFENNPVFFYMKETFLENFEGKRNVRDVTAHVCGVTARVCDVIAHVRDVKSREQFTR